MVHVSSHTFKREILRKVLGTFWFHFQIDDTKTDRMFPKTKKQYQIYKEFGNMG
jgi:hypothetical protein